MRIAVTGSHGVGKTLLAECLRMDLHLPLIPEVSRMVALRRGLTSLEGGLATGDFQHECLNFQAELEQRHARGFVIDRGLLDYLVYPIVLGTFRDGGLADYILAVRDRLWGYDLVVYVPIEFPLIGDGFRSEDVDFQRAVDSLIQLTLPLYEGAKVVEARGTLAKRVKTVMEAV